MRTFHPTDHAPLVSVIMPVFNAAKYLEYSINSILGQSFRDFEFIIVNDGSFDESRSIIEAYARRDERVKLINQDNHGVVASLNRGLSLSRGRYIARMDADDMSYPNRFEKQVMFLEQNVNCALLGTGATIYVEDRPTERALLHPTECCLLRWDLLFTSPFVHSSVMLRREVFQALGAYSEDLPRPSAEDYELWWRIANNYQVSNLSEVLHIYRESATSICRQRPRALADEVIRISGRNIALTIGRHDSDHSCFSLAAMHHGDYLRVPSRFNFAAAKEILHTAVTKLSLRTTDTPLLRQRLLNELGSLRRKTKHLWVRKLRAKFWVQLVNRSALTP